MGPCRSTWTTRGSTRWSTGRSTASPTSWPSLVRNVVVLVEDEPPEGEPDDLLGLYDGIALTERDSTISGSAAGPDLHLPRPAARLRRVRGRAGRGGADHRRARGGAPLRHRRRATARARLRLRRRPGSPGHSPRRDATTVTTAYAVPRRAPRPTVCTANVEYVVKPPQKPTPRSASARSVDAEPDEQPEQGRAGDVRQPDAERDALRVESLGEPVAQRRTDRGSQCHEQRRHGSTTGPLGGRPETRSARSTASRQAANVPPA